jgi:hypothetical protein
MLIGISGKIASGKDATTKIIQIITQSPNFSDEAVLSFLGRELLNPKFTNEKYGEALKQVICILIGCSREQLEDLDFKNKELKEDWWYFATTVNHNKISYLGNEDKFTGKFPIYIPTPRRLLQLVGTECGREILHPNVWVNALMSKYKKKFDGYYKDSKEGELKSRYKFPNWVISDVRFPNELAAVKDRDGVSIRVERPVKSSHHLEAAYQHESETALDNASFDFTINNTGTLLDLVKEVRKILIVLKII